jgi:hypothetical protein
MAIKRMLSSTEVADFPFRSLQDVERYLEVVKEKMNDDEEILRQLEQQFSRSAQRAALTFELNRPDSRPNPNITRGPKIDTQHVDKVVVPDLKKLKDHFLIVDEMHEKIDTLNTLHAQLSVTLRNVQGSNKTLQSVLNTKKSMEQKLKRAMDFLSKIGDAHAPKEFRKMVQTICDTLSEEFTYSDVTTAVYAVQHDNGDLTFSEYVKLTNFEDDDGDTYPEFWIVFTAALRPVQGERVKVNMTYYVNVMTHFQPPKPNYYGRPFGKVSEALKAIGVLMGIENVSVSLGVLPHGLSPNLLSKKSLDKGNHIADVIVDSNSVTVVLIKNTNKEETEKIRLGLHAEILDILKMHGHKKPILKNKVSYDGGTRRYSIKYTVATPVSKEELDTGVVDFLKEQHELDEDTVTDVVRAIKRGNERKRFAISSSTKLTSAKR